MAALSQVQAIVGKLYQEMGLPIFFSAPRDTFIIVAQRSLRLGVYGMSAMVLTSFLKALDVSDFQLGLFMTLTLLGDAAASLLLTLFADRLGRAKVLLGGSALMIFSGLVFAVSESYLVLLLAAICGVISPSGNEIGPFRAIEESILAQLTDSEERSTIFAWYLTLSGLALAFGSLSGGWITHFLQQSLSWTPIESYRFVFCAYAVTGAANSWLAWSLSEKVELEKTETSTEEEEGLIVEEEVVEKTSTKLLDLTPETKQKVWLLSGLFGIDNLSGGLVPITIIVYFFTTKFHVDEATLGNTFFTTSLVSAISNIVAGSLARHIGNVKTMAFTHLPSAILLALIPLPNNFQVARAILIAVFCTTKMDIAPRTAFLSSYVHANERTAVMGIINIARLVSQSAGPTLTGYLSGHGRIWVSFVAAGILQAIYDVAMLYFFLKVAAVS